MMHYDRNETTGAHVGKYYIQSIHDAGLVLSLLRDYSKNHGFVTVADYYEAIEVPVGFTHNSYGWTYEQMLNVRVIPENGVYYLNLPRATHIPYKEDTDIDFQERIVITDEESLKEAIDLVIDVLLDMYGRVIHTDSDSVVTDGEYGASIIYYESSVPFYVVLKTNNVVTWDGDILKIENNKYGNTYYFKIRKEEK